MNRRKLTWVGLLGALMLGVAGADEVKCGDCHKTDPEFSHPVGIVPSMRVPTHLPLENGRVTCNTCHEDRGAQAHMKRGGSMLRGSGLCAQCHDRSPALRSRMHGGSLTRAHLRWPGRDTTAVDETNSCLACHDGTLASDAWRDKKGEGKHAVGVRYDPGRRRRTRFRPAAALPAEVRLFDGRVGCGSCHNPYGGRPGLLALDNRGSRLCLSCHDM